MALDDIVRRKGTNRESISGASKNWGAMRNQQATIGRRPEPYTQLVQWAGKGSRMRGGYKECKVLPDSDVHHTAGYIAAAMRSGSTLSVPGGSAVSLNQAVKAIALARSFLEEECFDLTVRPRLTDQDQTSDVELQISPTADDWVREEIASSEAMELFVSSESSPGRVAGAIAKLTREERQVVCTAMGPQATQNVAKSVSLARQYLDVDGVDLCFVPEFAHTEDGASMLRIYVFSLFKDCLVRPNADVHQTAGYIAAGVRSGAPPLVLADSLAGANQAMKALAVARSFLERDKLDIIVAPHFQDYYEDASSCNVKLLLALVSDDSVREATHCNSAVQLSVSAESEPTKVAGAIAGSAREGSPMYCTAMGPQAVLRTVKSIFLARRYLEADALYPYFVPEFGKSSDGASLMYFHVLLQ